MANNAINAPNTSHDVLVGSATGYSSVSLGASGNVLTSNGLSASPSFKSAAGNLVLISTQTASASSELVFNSIPGTYGNYFLNWQNVIPTTNGSSLWMLFSSNNGSTYDIYNNDVGLHYTNYNSASFVSVSNPAQSAVSAGISSSIGCSGYAYLYGINLSAVFYITGMSNWYNGTTTQFGHFGGDEISGVNAFKVLMSSGTIASGIFTLYGLST